MQIEDSPLDRTPDLVAKVRKLREQAEKEMNQFTHTDDYDVRCVVGQKPKAVPQPEEAAPATPAGGGAKRKRARPSEDQAMIECSSAPLEQGEKGDGQ